MRTFTHGLIGMVMLATPALAQDMGDEGESKTMVVFTSGQTDRSSTIVDTFKSVGDLNATTLSFDLGTDEEQAYFVAESLQGFQATMIFAVGDIALKVAAREFTDIPIIYADASSATAAGVGREDILEVEDRVSPKALVDQLMALTPRTKSIGTIYSVRDTSPYWSQLRDEVEGRGLHYQPARVANPFEVRNAARTLSNMDWVVLQPDPRLWTPNSLANLYSVAESDDLPVVGFSQDHFDSPQPPGLVATVDAEGIGTAAAEMARQLFVDGKPFEQITVGYAQPVLYGNKRALQRTGLNVTKKRTQGIAGWDE